MNRSHNLSYFIIIISLFILILFSLLIGAHKINFANLLVSKIQQQIIYFRLTRVILILVAGSSLAASGASLQAIFQNPLADPHLFGIAGGSAIGAALVIAFSPVYYFFSPSLGAIIGGLFAFIFIYFILSRISTKLSFHALLLGVLINSVAAGLITCLKISLPAQKTQSLLYWLVGNINIVSSYNLIFIIIFWLIGLRLLLNLKSQLEIISLGPEESIILGVEPNYIIRQTILANCILVGNVVAFAGMIGFIGLVTPHLIRLVISAHMRVLLPLSALLGALLLIFFDIISKLSFFIIGSELPVGAISALILAPIFFIILLRASHEH